jgi:ribosomal protein S18 acetylase RimI-like enzyme
MDAYDHNVVTEILTYRTIELPRDAARAVAYHADACRESFGAGDYERRLERPEHYLGRLAAGIEEFPDGHLLALAAGGECVGQMELQVPYGMESGYVNLFYVAPEFRRRGYGRAMHARAERYFRSWEARRIELHASPTNPAAMRFYDAMGYRVVGREGDMVRMRKGL